MSILIKFLDGINGMNTLEAFNRTLFLMVNATASTPGWQIDVARLIADYAICLVPLALVAVWLSGDKRQRDAAARACCVAGLAFGA